MDKLGLGEVMAHIDIINALHQPIVDNKKNRVALINHVCMVCADRRKCVRRQIRCRATDITMIQINILTPIVSIEDPGEADLDIPPFSRLLTIGEVITPFNWALSEYLKEERAATIHLALSMMRQQHELDEMDELLSLKLHLPPNHGLNLELMKTLTSTKVTR